MLSEVVRIGTGTLAAVDGYRVAGKTGTARKPLVGQRGYEEGAYVSSFAGFVPAEQPRLSAMVILDQPTPIFGGLVAAPVFADLARYALRELRIPPPLGGQAATSARDADIESAKGVGDLGDARAPDTLPAPPTVTAAGPAPTTSRGAATAPTPSTPTPASTVAARRSSTTTTASAARAGPPRSTSTTGTVSRRAVSPATRR